MVDSNDFQNAVELINESGSILITTHIRLDGDTCGRTVYFEEVTFVVYITTVYLY